jgi:type II secretory ATPase GspE/PulE/Tfp pilus assembly ATPase PilB-like protein
VRTLCPKCKEAYNPTKDEFEHLLENYGVFFFDHLHTTYSDKLVLYRTKGCKHCNNTGYKGRVGVFELLIANRSLRKHIIERAPVDIIKQDAINEGMTTLIQEGIRLIFDGKTDFNQVMSVCAL